MKKNVGKIDRIIRLVLGGGLIILGLFTSYWWFLPAAALILTGLMGFCTPYVCLGINTCSVKEKEQ